MKSDTERKIFYSEKLHERKNRLHVHLSKDLRAKTTTKKRAIQVRKNDRVRVMRGSHAGKEAKVSRVSVIGMKVFLEGMTVKNQRGKEILVPFQPSNLLLISLDSSKERKALFSETAFVKETKTKAETKGEIKEKKMEEVTGNKDGENKENKEKETKEKENKELKELDKEMNRQRNLQENKLPLKVAQKTNQDL